MNGTFDMGVDVYNETNDISVEWNETYGIIEFETFFDGKEMSDDLKPYSYQLVQERVEEEASTAASEDKDEEGDYRYEAMKQRKLDEEFE
jgi:hypothetical protein